MKKIFVIISILTAINVHAQLVNCNPDPQGEKWWAGGDIALTESEWAEIPQLTLTPESAAMPLPLVVDNSQLQYFPPIFHQVDGSCAQAAGIGYIFTYEINRVRNVAANTNINLYPHLYTYNFLYHNSLNGHGSSTHEGWEIAIQNGIPNEDVYDNPYEPEDSLILLFWMDGYDKYLSAMNNRLKAYYELNLMNLVITLTC